MYRPPKYYIAVWGAWHFNKNSDSSSAVFFSSVNKTQVKTQLRTPDAGFQKYNCSFISNREVSRAVHVLKLSRVAFHWFLQYFYSNFSNIIKRATQARVVVELSNDTVGADTRQEVSWYSVPFSTIIQFRHHRPTLYSWSVEASPRKTNSLSGGGTENPNAQRVPTIVPKARVCLEGLQRPDVQSTLLSVFIWCLKCGDGERGEP